MDSNACKVVRKPYRYVGDDFWLYIAEIEAYLKEPPVRSTRYVVADDFAEAEELLERSLGDGLCIIKLERVYCGSGVMIFPVRDFIYDSRDDG